MQNKTQKPNYFFIVPQTLMQQFVVAIGKMNFNLNDAEIMLDIKHSFLECNKVKEETVPQVEETPELKKK